MEKVLGDIDAEAVRPVDPLVAENLPPVVVVTDLNHDHLRACSPRGPTWCRAARC
ncbi:MAG: hypothetical protein WB818_05365 [Desulfobacterales bacterium]